MADQVNISDHGEAAFTVFRVTDGALVEYDDVKAFVLDEDDKAATEAFRIVCGVCGSDNCEVENNVRMGSSWTGLYGSMDINCRDCKAYRTIYDP